MGQQGEWDRERWGWVGRWRRTGCSRAVTVLVTRSWQARERRTPGNRCSRLSTPGVTALGATAGGGFCAHGRAHAVMVGEGALRLTVSREVMPGGTWAIQRGSEGGSIPAVRRTAARGWAGAPEADRQEEIPGALCPERRVSSGGGRTGTGVNPPAPALRAPTPSTAPCICCSVQPYRKANSGRPGTLCPIEASPVASPFTVPPSLAATAGQTLAEGQRPGLAGEVTASGAGAVPRLCQCCPAGGSVWVATLSPVHAK